MPKRKAKDWLDLIKDSFTAFSDLCSCLGVYSQELVDWCTKGGSFDHSIRSKEKPFLLDAFALLLAFEP